MQILLIDLENITPASLSGWSVEWPIYLFSGEKQDKVKIDLVKSLLPHGKAVHWVEMVGGGKNALDFHIAFYLGQLSLRHPGAGFKVLSYDKGFDPLLHHLKQIGIHCERVEKVPANPVTQKRSPAKPTTPKTSPDPSKDLKVVFAGFADRLHHIPKANRPKTVAKLRNHFKSQFKIEDESHTDQMMEFLQTQKKILVEESKIHYLFDAESILPLGPDASRHEAC